MSDFGCSTKTKRMSLSCASFSTSHKAPTKALLFPVCLRMCSHEHTQRHTHKPTHTHNTHAHTCIHTDTKTHKQTRTHHCKVPRGHKGAKHTLFFHHPYLGTHLFWSKALLFNWREAVQWSTSMQRCTLVITLLNRHMCKTYLATSALPLHNIAPWGHLSGGVIHKDRR